MTADPLRKQGLPRLSLAAKLAIAMTTLVVVAVASITMLSIQREQANFRAELEGQAALLVDVVRTSIPNALYLLDVQALADITADLAATERGITGRIYDPAGRVLADSANPAPVYAVDPDPEGMALIASTGVSYQWDADALHAGIPVIVGRRVIGAVGVTLPTDALAAKMVQVRDQGLLIGLIAGVIGAGVSIALSRYITIPLRTLTTASQRVAEGNFGQPVRIETGDELSDLAAAFNLMSGRLRDLVDRLKGRAADLEVANKKAEEASRLKSEFLATMSHELRTPLNAIIGFSDMLLMGMCGPLNEKQAHKISRSLENGKRLLGLVNDILDIARIEAGRVEIEIEPFAPSALADRVAAQMTSLADAKGLTFKTSADPALPLVLLGDEKHLEQIVVNLLSNAFKFTDTGSVELRFGRKGDEWTICVQDTGIGIPPHAMDFIFEEFRQVDGTSTRAYQGSGLGLAITRQLVQIMNGKIAVESRLGEGSTFTITLPLRQHELAAQLAFA